VGGGGEVWHKKGVLTKAESETEWFLCDAYSSAVGMMDPPDTVHCVDPWEAELKDRACTGGDCFSRSGV